MGLNAYDLRFILTARELGCKLDEICTLGRMNLNARPGEVEAVLSEYGCFNSSLWDRFDRHDPVPYADPVLEFLGGGHVASMDFSDYEKASIIHDLNQPIPDKLRNRFDLVIDGGTLEHIFQYPTALANAMRMTRVGGHVFLKTPSNNLCGHGFYQFSPELYFRAFTPANGFELLRIYVTGKRRGKFYHVVDPQHVHGRVQLLSPDVALLLVHARKIADVEPFSRPPQQSDYVSTWGEVASATSPEQRDGRLKAMLRKRLTPDQVRRISVYLNRLRQRLRVRQWRKESRLSNRRFYLPVTNWEVTTASVTGAQPPALAAHSSRPAAVFHPRETPTPEPAAT